MLRIVKNKVNSKKFNTDKTVSLSDNVFKNWAAVVADIISIAADGLGFTLKAGTYTATGETIGWDNETGEEYTYVPSYTFETDIVFPSTGSIYAEYTPLNYTSKAPTIKSATCYLIDAQNNYLTTTVSGTTLTCNYKTSTYGNVTNIDNLYIVLDVDKDEKYGPYHIASLPTTIVVKHTATSQYNLITDQWNADYLGVGTLEIVANDGTVRDSFAFDRKQASWDAYQMTYSYTYKDGEERVLADDEYLRFVVSWDLSKVSYHYIGGTGGSTVELFKVFVNNWYNDWYESGTYKLGLRGDDTFLQISQDWENIWDLGYFDYEEGSPKILKWHK